MSLNEIRFPAAVPDAPADRDTDFWIRQACAARQAELEMRRELATKDAEIAALKAAQATMVSSLNELLCMPGEDDAKSTAERIVRIGRARAAIAQAVQP